MPSGQQAAAEFFDLAIRRFAAPHKALHAIRVLDLGCGAGELTAALLKRGYDVHGCDIQGPWTEPPVVALDRVRFISMEPYRLPYE